MRGNINARRQKPNEPNGAAGKGPSEEEKQREKAREAKRRERMRNHIVKLNNPKAVIELENEPAYLRRGIQLDDLPNTEKPTYSRFSISEDEPHISDGNAYLHDNVD